MSLLQMAHAICLKSPNFSKVDEEVTIDGNNGPFFLVTSFQDIAEFNENHQPGEKLEYEIYFDEGKLHRHCINTGDVQDFDTIEALMNDIQA